MFEMMSPVAETDGTPPSRIAAAPPPAAPAPPVLPGFSTPSPPRPPQIWSIVLPTNVAFGPPPTKMPTPTPPGLPGDPGTSPFVPRAPCTLRTVFHHRSAD